MSTPRPITPKRKAPTAAEKEAALKAAEEKVKATIAEDQAWLDNKSKDMSPAEKEVLFKELSVSCAATNMKDGKIVLACPLPTKGLKYCVYSEPFECGDGKTAGGLNAKGIPRPGCEVPGSTYEKLRAGPPPNKIDGSFVTKAEGGSFRSPYVPWGPVVSAEKDKQGVEKVVTGGNHSGVTIGTGVDLGAIGSQGSEAKRAADKKAYLDRLRTADVSEPTRTYVEKFLGLQKSDACSALRSAEKYEIPQADIEKIDLDAMATRAPGLRASFDEVADEKEDSLRVQIQRTTDPEKKRALQAQLDGLRSFDELSEAEQTILFSTYYHEGSIARRPPPDKKKPEEKKKLLPKPIVNDMLSGKPFRDSLEQKTQSKNKVVADRGKMELKYFDSTQETASSPPAVPARPGTQPQAIP